MRGRIGCRGGATAVPTHALFHSIRRRGRGGRTVLSFVSFFCQNSSPSRFPWCELYLVGTGLGGGQRGARNVLPPRGQQTGNGQNVHRHSLDRLDASMNKLKKNTSVGLSAHRNTTDLAGLQLADRTSRRASDERRARGRREGTSNDTEDKTEGRARKVTTTVLLTAKCLSRPSILY